MTCHDPEEDLGKIEDRIREVVDYSSAEKIDKGFSFEKKYLLSGPGEKSYVVRISAADGEEHIERKRAEFDVIRRLGKYSSIVPGACSFGTSGDGKSCYMILEYMEGLDLEDSIGSLGEDEQYEIGLQAGRELFNLHRLDAPRFPSSWHERYSAKYTRKCEVFDEYALDPVIIDMGRLSRYILENESCMRCRRETFLHDDYHPANLIATDGRLSGIIDFNRYDWGDPVHDFVKLAYFSSAISIPFSAGQVDGYNGGDVPFEFWKKYALYTAMTIVPDMVWSHWYSGQTGSPDEIERMQERVKRVWLDHDGFNEDIPGWYRDFNKPNTTF